MITIGLPTYDSNTELFFTVQALRMYQDISECQILVMDNFGSFDTIKLCAELRVEYDLYNKVHGTAQVRNKIFERARGDFVLVMDSHILLWLDAIKNLKLWVGQNEGCGDLVHGPYVKSHMEFCHTRYNDEWRNEMWGTWGPETPLEELPHHVFEIPMMGLGVFGCFKDKWLGFNEDCVGFGGVEGVIHEKYRRAGRTSLCLPFLKWVHHFNGPKTFPLYLEEKVRNFVLGFEENHMDPTPLYEHFGRDLVHRIEQEILDGRAAKSMVQRLGDTTEGREHDKGESSGSDNLWRFQGDILTHIGPGDPVSVPDRDVDGQENGQETKRVLENA